MADFPGLNPQDATILRSIFTDAVSASRGTATRPDHALRERLRHYERTAVAIGLDPQTLQVIRSARRLVGDGKLLPRDAAGL